MSTLSGIGSGAWTARAMPDMSAMRQRMFAKADADGSGGVDEAELQQMLSKVSERTGQDVGQASDLMTKWDSDGDGGLSSDELDTGMKSLMPQPSSTMEFAQMRGGPSMGGMPPPPPPGKEGDEGGGVGGVQGGGESSCADSATTACTASSGSADAMDTNGDGIVSAGERAAAELEKLVESLTAAIDTNGDKSLTDDEVSDFLAQVQQSIDALA